MAIVYPAPTHDSRTGKGGWREVDTIDERDSLPEEYIRVGSVVVVKEDGPTIWFRKSETEWVHLIEYGTDLTDRVLYLEEEVVKRLTTTQVVTLINKALEENGLEPTDPPVDPPDPGDDEAYILLEDGSRLETEDGQYLEVE